MDLIRLSIEKPVAVIVGVLLTILFGVLALLNIPIQLTPNVDSTVVVVTTTWEGASPREIEQDIVEEQEDKLKGVANLRKLTSQSIEGQAQITLEFHVGTDVQAALREVSDKLREVPEYPENVDEPVIEASDPENRDYIAWIIFESDDPDFDVRTLQDFAEDWIKPALERVEGMSTVGVLGGWERELQVRVDTTRLAQRRITYGDVADALRRENLDVSAGSLDEGKTSVTVRTAGRFETEEDVERTVIASIDGVPVRVGDVADAVLTYKEPNSFVRSKGRNVIAINAQREVGSNVIEVMDGLKAALIELNAEGGLLDTQARKLGLSGPLRLRQVYDQTIYIDQAIELVEDNLYIGGILTILAMFPFLRSFRTVGIISLSIPIALVGTFVVMVAMGRNLNVISLAGLAFAVGVVVDSSTVVLENIFRHMEQFGITAKQASYRATKEVWSAVLASTLTNVVVFIPVLFIQEEVGQLFRDISLALCVSVFLGLIISITVVPCAAHYWLKPPKTKRAAHPQEAGGPSAWLGRTIYVLCGSVTARVAVVVALTVASIWGSVQLMPPTDYLPAGNRNLVFGMLIPPPGYSLDKQMELGHRVEADIRPFWEAGELVGDEAAYGAAVAQLPQVPTFDWATMSPGAPITPPTIENYFFVGFNGIMFHGGIADDDKRVQDMVTLFNHATRAENVPGVIGFAFQAPLFRLSGATGSSIDIEFSGDDLTQVVESANAAYQALAGEFGYANVQSNPGNFQLPAPEIRVEIDRERAADLGLSTRDIGLAARALGDGAIVGEFYLRGESIDLKLIDAAAAEHTERVARAAGEGLADEAGAGAEWDLAMLADMPIATPTGQTVPVSSVARLTRTTAAQQINHVEQRRAVSLEFTAPPGMPLEAAMEAVEARVAALRAQGAIAPAVQTELAGSADKLTSVKNTLLGDGTLMGLIGSRMFLALLINYLVMCVLFESFLYPFVILFSVPSAAFGGFLCLRLVHFWSERDPSMPTQNLDVLTMLGFVILLGTVVANAILIVYQALNFMRGFGETETDVVEKMPPRKAIAESVRTRLRPIMMTSLTTVTGTLPLVLMPGSGSELYRGLGSVVTGGLIMSTIFTLVLVPLLLSLVIDARMALSSLGSASRRTAAVSRPAPTQPPTSPVPTAAPAGAITARPDSAPRPAVGAPSAAPSAAGAKAAAESPSHSAPPHRPVSRPAPSVDDAPPTGASPAPVHR